MLHSISVKNDEEESIKISLKLSEKLIYDVYKNKGENGTKALEFLDKNVDKIHKFK